ncbi:hypothetical protein [Amycolatopsis australiensis]|uniref:hypothetical protein n=1 Tax=Amycolatopsis australiensis TaxID=546364 RepID=UPI0015A69D70|nr:hypothetical protein [Amycolatopsis australiensis]
MSGVKIMVRTLVSRRRSMQFGSLMAVLAIAAMAVIVPNQQAAAADQPSQCPATVAQAV